MRVYSCCATLLTFALMVLDPACAASIYDEAMKAYHNKDYVKAAGLFLDEANHGNAQAQCNLGYMYDNGQGVKQDVQEALNWYRLSADQGNAQAQNNLGALYYKGQGVPQDYHEAAKWYRLAAGQGNSLAQGNLGLMYLMGQGLPEDFVEAYAWLAVAAANGNEASRGNLETLSKNMTPFQLEKAQNLAKEYLESTRN